MDDVKAYLFQLLYKLAWWVQFLFFLYLGSVKIYAPIARSPGARDGMGLLFVMGFVLLAAAIATAVAAALEVMVLRAIFPDWEPPDLD